MPYVLEQRSKREFEQQGRSDNVGSFRATRARDLEAVFTYRSQVSEFSQVVSPNTIGNDYVENLKYRENYLNKMILDAQGRPGNRSVFSNTDQGHPFGVLKIKTDSSENSISGGPTNYLATNVVPDGGFARIDSSGNLVPASTQYDLGGDFFSSKGCSSISSWKDISAPAVFRDWNPIATQQLNAMNPLKSGVSLAVTVAELLRGDVPSLTLNLRRHIDSISRLRAKYRTFQDASKAIGGGYLGWQFGWAPVISDVKKALEILMDLDGALYTSNSTRRKRTWSVYSANAGRTSWARGWGPVSPLNQSWTDGNNRSKLLTPRYTGVSGVTSYIGAFNIPTDVAVFTKADVRTSARFLTGAVPDRRANTWLDQGVELLGLKLDAQTLWELTPWSWLVDWFTNIGSVIQSLSTLGLDNTLLNYAYSTIRLQNNVSVLGRPASTGSYSLKGKFTFRAETEMKVRRVASPFGFSVAWEQLNAGQIAILTALGLARQR